jgi:hypothetical protein
VTRDETLQDIRNWFAMQGAPWFLTFSWEGDICWADLERTDNPAAFTPRYGRGTDELTAARRAKERWIQEQGE